jgi:ubiquinol-cytochrome c reductase cytochrome c subunit
MNELGEARAAESPSRRPARRFRLAAAWLFAAFAVPAAAIAFTASPGGTARADAATLRALTQASSSDLIGAGQTLFLQTCSTCHGPLGQGTGQGPPVIGLGPADYDFQMSTGRMPLAAPGTQGIRRPPVLTHAQIDAIIAYLVSLDPSGMPIPNVDPAAGNLSVGSRLFLSNCAPCHSASGNGGAVGAQVAPSLHEATATQIAEAVRIGPGTMPVYDRRTIPDDQLNSLVRYVLYLRQPDSPGGLTLGYFGPIVEGFVALFIGLAAMLLVTRYIGARS